ncbi:MAG: PTS system mannose/fructose/sorbose family transporter subunit IID [bacterium]
MTSLTFVEKLRLLWRSLFVQVFWNYRTMQGEGFLFTLLPFLRRLGADSEERQRLLKLSGGFMNAHPCLAPMAIGAMLRRMADGEDSEEEPWHIWREELCAPLGTLGDRLIWDSWKPVIFTLAAITLLLFGSSRMILPLSLLILLLYNGPLVGLRFWGLGTGWRSGREVSNATQKLFFAHAKVWIDRVGAMFLGLLFAIGFVESSLLQPLATVQFGFAFALLWVSSAANWPLISSLLLALGFVPFSAWLAQWIF